MASLPFLQGSLTLDMLYHIWYNMGMNDSLKILPARFFKTASGTEPVREWLKGLDKEDSRIIGGGISIGEKWLRTRTTLGCSPPRRKHPRGMVCRRFIWMKRPAAFSFNCSGKDF